MPRQRHNTPRIWTGPRSIAGPIVLVLLVCLSASATARSVVAQQQVQQAWSRFRAAYVQRDVALVCAMLSAPAQADIKAQVGKRGCAAAAESWFKSVQFDRQAAVHARLVWVRVQGTRAETRDTDPNSPARDWIRIRGHWKLASFLIVG